MQSKIESARLAFVAAAREYGSDPLAEEGAILSVGRDFLPAHAVAVLDGGAPTVEYYEWLREQTETAQAEHDREYAAGHEWHEAEEWEPVAWAAEYRGADLSVERVYTAAPHWEWLASYGHPTDESKSFDGEGRVGSLDDAKRAAIAFVDAMRGEEPE